MTICPGDFQIVRDRLLVDGKPPDVVGCAWQKIGCKLICRKGLGMSQTCIGTQSSILGDFILTDVLISVFMYLRNYVIILILAYRGTLIIRYELKYHCGW